MDNVFKSFPPLESNITTNKKEDQEAIQTDLKRVLIGGAIAALITDRRAAIR